MPNSEKIKISVIIPCFNEEKFLPSLFDALTKLSTAKNSYEVIIVDNGSSDRSVEIARENNAVVLIEPKGNISKLRNIGAQHASGEIFAFLDADCLPQSEWLVEASKYKQFSDVGLFGNIPLCTSDGTWVEKAWLGVSPKGVNDVDFICTANMFIKKSVFEQVRGFNENLTTGEDYDICQRILQAGYRIVHDDKVAVIHLRYPKTLFARYKKEIWYGKEMFNILKIKPLYKPFWTSLIFGCSLFVVIFSFFSGSFGAIFKFSLFLFLFLPILSAAFKVMQSKRYKYFFQLVILYFVYLAGRSTSILRYGKHIITKIV
ncbi:MAG: glycosyltransferase [Thermotogota bacterium]|nr:glycosyltransferase [Thermotogota bacterium]